MKKIICDKIYDILVVGASKAGINYLSTLPYLKENIAIVSKTYPDIINLFDEIDKFKKTVKYASYYHGLITVELENNELLLTKNLVIATETKVDPNSCLAKYYYKNVNLAGSFDEAIIIVAGNSNEAAEFAIKMSKLAKKVYLLIDELKVNCKPANRLKLTNIKKIQVLPQTKIKAVKENQAIFVDTDSFDRIACSKLFAFGPKVPDIFDTANLIELDDKGYILVNENNETTLVPAIKAIGGCCKKVEE